MHIEDAKKVLRYLKGTLSFSVINEKGKEGELLGWYDSNYVGDFYD